MSRFYHHLINIESLFIELDELELSVKQKNELAQLVDSNLHHTILDLVLSELRADDKRIFLQNLRDDNHQKIWNHLNSKIDNLEKKIENSIKQIKKELHKDIKEAKRSK